ncbi:hypothetical protein F2P79_019878 [Pimephales promelas]|nr:hypothetical protein F2P79_019878 [Pimephales promelas]
MKNDDISSVVRNDFLILQFSQCLYNKIGSDPTKFEYIKQKVRETGRLLLTLRTKYSIFNFEDAVKPNNFCKVVEAVKDLAAYDDKSQSYMTPSLALKLGHSLRKIGDIILCRAIATEDDGMTKAAERFKRLCTREVSKMSLECFSKRDQAPLHDDKAVCLSPFEQNISKNFSRVEIMGKNKRKVAILLNPELVRAMKLLVDKRDACEVDRDNPFLFGIPKCSPTSFFRGQDYVWLFASLCGAQHPEYLRSTQLRKHVATVSQILNLEANELDQLANFLGLDIRVHRDYYRSTDATVDIAKISKLLLAMENGTLANYQGKSLDDIEMEDEIDLELDEEEISDEDDKESEPVRGVRDTKFRKIVRRHWSPNEVNAVMKHFKNHISKGHLATSAECARCKTAESTVLRERTIQNIRDFVRNREEHDHRCKPCYTAGDDHEVSLAPDGLTSLRVTSNNTESLWRMQSSWHKIAGTGKNWFIWSAQRTGTGYSNV